MRECQKCTSCKQVVHDRCVASFRSLCIQEKNPLVLLLSDLLSLGALPSVRDQVCFNFLP